MLSNHINNFKLSKNIPKKFVSNLDEILYQYENFNPKKELKLSFEYGLQNNYNSSIIPSPNITEKNLDSSSNLSNLNQEISEFQCINTLQGHTEKIVSLILLNSGELASGSYDDSIRIWDKDGIKENKKIIETGHVFCLLEFDDNMLLSGTSENFINLWNLNTNTNKKMHQFIGHKLWVNCLIKINDNIFASASNDSQIKIWNYRTRTCIKTLKGHIDCILTLINLKNGNLCSGSADLTIRIWDWEEKDNNKILIAILRGHEKWVKCVYELSNGLLISGSDDKTIKIWKDKINIMTLIGHTHSVRAFCQLNDNYFVSGSFDGTIKIWEINEKKCVQTLSGHESNVIGVVRINGHMIGSCSNDKTIKIWSDK